VSEETRKKAGEKNRREIEKRIRGTLDGNPALASAEANPKDSKPSRSDERKKQIRKNGRNRERALEIAQCFELIAPTTNAGSDGVLAQNEDLEALAAAIRQGRADLLELALSARQCSAPPETPDSRLMNGNGDLAAKAKAKERRVTFERSFKNTPERKRAVAEWAAYLLANGYCDLVGGISPEISKAAIISTLEVIFPEESRAIPPISNKKAHAAFWVSVGVESEQSRGSEPKDINDMINRLKKWVAKKSDSQGFQK
jgi:hypothetical protein